MWSFFINGGLGETRTLDQLIKSQLLYQLSYKPKIFTNFKEIIQQIVTNIKKIEIDGLIYIG